MTAKESINSNEKTESLKAMERDALKAIKAAQDTGHDHLVCRWQEALAEVRRLMASKAH